MSLWHQIGLQLQNPTGFAGRLTGGVMRFVNDVPNRLAVTALEIDPGETVLELGCGPGHGIKLLASHPSVGPVHGIDQSSVMLEQARARNLTAIQAGRVFLLRGRFQSLPFADVSIDKILAVNVIYFWENPGSVLREIRRVLRPNGRVSIYATDETSMRHWKFAGPATHRHYGEVELAAALLDGGFESTGTRVWKIKLKGGIRGLLATMSRAE